MSVFVDTSVWSLALRRSPPSGVPEVELLASYLERGDLVVTTGMVLRELLQGFQGPRAKRAITKEFSLLPMIRPDIEDHIEAADLRNRCRRKGVQVGTIDALLAQFRSPEGKPHRVARNPDLRRRWHVRDGLVTTVSHRLQSTLRLKTMPRPNLSGGYRPQSPDTDATAERYLFDRLRRLPLWRKAEMLSAATQAAYGLAMAGLRLRHPAASEPELRRRYAALVLGRDASIALFGWDPEREGW